MAGSLNHIIDDDGRFTMDLIDNLGDAHEALEECYALIIELSKGNMTKVSKACKKFGFVDPYEKENRFEDDPISQPMCMVIYELTD